MSKYFRLIALILAFNLAFYCNIKSDASSSKSSDQVTQEKEQLEEELEDATSESDDLKSGLKDTQSAINNLSDKKNQIENYVEELDGQLNDVSNKIEEISKQMDAKQHEIEETTKELQQAEEDVKIQYEAMKNRIKFTYENGNTAYIELILESKSIAQFLNRAEYVSKMAAYDRDMLNKFEETKDYVATTKETLEEEQVELETLKAESEDKQSQVAGLIDTKSAQIVQYESDISSAKDLEEEYEDDIKAQNEVIAALEASVAAKKAEIKRIQEAEAAAAAAGSNTSKTTATNITTTYDGGTFVWPCPSSTRISSEFGYRLHPVLNVTKFHNGIDIAASTGSAIIAAYKGTVVGAGYNSSMGNYVMIDHGDGLYTIYMHASALYVSNGQNVAKGDKIAAVGSTGRSTGPHLHFGVRLNGSYVNPHSYVG